MHARYAAATDGGPSQHNSSSSGQTVNPDEAGGNPTAIIVVMLVLLLEAGCDAGLDDEAFHTPRGILEESMAGRPGELSLLPVSMLMALGLN